MTPTAPAAFQPLQGVRILSLALNLPGPAALMRCRQMGAACLKLEPPGGDPMQQYNLAAYRQLHEHIEMLTADLKTEAGQLLLHRELAQADVLITSFRPSALTKLGLTWPALHRQHPQLSQVAIVGAPGERGEEAGHDLTYLAESGLVTGLDLPATLYADMGGSLMASEAVLQAVMHQRRQGTGVYLEIALSSAAGYLALPRAWGLTQPGAAIGGGHAGYRVYPCQDGRVALAALEPHFALRLCAAASIEAASMQAMFEPATHEAVAAFLLTRTRRELDALAVEKDIPLFTLED
ncbi:CoA transferase [Polaromonas sp. DSR2-3-2]|uniref:CoA transferase n=1 Tax=unclassified Polaromonas TaxID=2638319 RepID=UPI003CF0E288